MKRILATLVTSFLAASAFATTPVAQPLTQRTAAHKATEVKAKHGKKTNRQNVSNLKHSSITPSAKKSVVIN